MESEQLTKGPEEGQWPHSSGSEKEEEAASIASESERHHRCHRLDLSITSSQSTPDLFPVLSNDMMDRSVRKNMKKANSVQDTTNCVNLDFIVLSIKELELLEKMENKLMKLEKLLNCSQVMKKEPICHRITKLLDVHTSVLNRLETSQKKWETLKASANVKDVDGLPRQSLRKRKLKVLVDRLKSLVEKANSLAESSSKVKSNRLNRRKGSRRKASKENTETSSETENVVYDGEWMMDGTGTGEKDEEVVVTYVSPSLQNRTNLPLRRSSESATNPLNKRNRVGNGTKNRWRILLISEEELSGFERNDRNSQGSDVIQIW